MASVVPSLLPQPLAHPDVEHPASKERENLYRTEGSHPERLNSLLGSQSGSFTRRTVDRSERTLALGIGKLPKSYLNDDFLGNRHTQNPATVFRGLKGQNRRIYASKGNPGWTLVQDLARSTREDPERGYLAKILGPFRGPTSKALFSLDKRKTQGQSPIEERAAARKGC